MKMQTDICSYSYHKCFECVIVKFSGGSRFGDWGWAMGGVRDGAPSRRREGVLEERKLQHFFFARHASEESFGVNNDSKFAQIEDDFG